MYGLKYGAVPVVRATGGLDDTIEEFDPATGTGTGLKFDEPTPAALVGAVRRAVGVYGRKTAWAQVLRNAMAADFSWDRSARRYAELYAKITE